MRKSVVFGIFCILVLSSITIAVGDNDNSRKHIVYIKGNNLYSISCKINGSIKLRWYTTIYFSHITDFVQFNFVKRFNQEDTEITVIDNGKKEVYKGDLYIRFDLSTKVSFVIENNRSGFMLIAFCDDVTVTEV